MSTDESHGSAVVKPGQFLKINGEWHQKLYDDSFEMSVLTKLGDREIHEKHVPEVGDGCPNPDCDGHVEQVNDKRWCSNKCYEWRCVTPQEGDECKPYGDCDGTLHELECDSGVKYECDTCSMKGWSNAVTWEEAELPEWMGDDDE